jgi:DNA-binding ferritin-like protein (Dps family)
MASIESDQVQNMFDLLGASTPVVEIGNFEFKETGSRTSPACTISYNGEQILRRKFDEITPSHVIELLDIPHKYGNSESVEEYLEWENVGDTEYLREWTTPLDGNSLYITVNSHRRENSFEVHGPVEDSSTWKGYGRGTVKDIAVNGRQFETMESAFIYAVNYMTVYNPYEIDRLVRMESIAEEEFLDISGVGEKTVEEIVYEEHIRTYEEFKQDVSALSRNYREDAKDELEQKIAVNGRQFETMESAFIYAVNYMTVYNPYEIDRLVRMESIAEEEFLDISGVGEKTVEEIVYEEHIRTYEEFKQDVSALSRNYREDAKDELEQKIANEDEIYEHSFVKEVSAEIAVKNI